MKTSSVEDDVVKYIRWVGTPEFNSDEYLNYGCDYFQSLFDNDNPGGRADGNNQHVLDYVIRPGRDR